MVTTLERHILKIVCAFFMIVRLDGYLVAKTLFPFNASSINFDFVHPLKEQSKLSRLNALSLMEIQIRILSSFFLFIMVFFCAFGLLFEMNVVPLCRHDCEIMWIGTSVLIPILLHVWFLCWEHFAPSFFVRIEKCQLLFRRKSISFSFSILSNIMFLISLSISSIVPHIISGLITLTSMYLP